MCDITRYYITLVKSILNQGHCFPPLSSSDTCRNVLPIEAYICVKILRKKKKVLYNLANNLIIYRKLNETKKLKTTNLN